MVSSKIITIFILTVICVLLQLPSNVSAESKERFCGNKLNQMIDFICQGHTASRLKKSSGMCRMPKYL